MILFRYILKGVGESRHPCRTSTVIRNQSPKLLLKRTAPSGLVVGVFSEWDKVRADVPFHGCLHNCMPDPVEGLLEIIEGMVDVLLVLVVFLTVCS